MPLNMVNLMDDAGFGQLCKSGGYEYKIILHLGSNLALAVPANAPMPCNVKLIAIDPKQKEEKPDENQGADGKTVEETPKPTDKNLPEKPVDTVH